ncbi:MAG: DHCW motif cupin fold protein [Elusimicrobiota bacterium]
MPKTEHIGERSVAFWRTREFSGVRVRVVEYSPDYLADHGCSKGHILLVLEGGPSTGSATGEASR